MIQYASILRMSGVNSQLLWLRASVSIFRVSPFICCVFIPFSCAKGLRPRRTATHLLLTRSFSLHGRDQPRIIGHLRYQGEPVHLSEEYTYRNTTVTSIGFPGTQEGVSVMYESQTLGATFTGGIRNPGGQMMVQIHPAETWIFARKKNSRGPSNFVHFVNILRIWWV